MSCESCGYIITNAEVSRVFGDTILSIEQGLFLDSLSVEPTPGTVKLLIFR